MILKRKKKKVYDCNRFRLNKFSEYEDNSFNIMVKGIDDEELLTILGVIFHNDKYYIKKSNNEGFYDTNDGCNVIFAPHGISYNEDTNDCFVIFKARNSCFTIDVNIENFDWLVFLADDIKDEDQDIIVDDKEGGKLL